MADRLDDYILGTGWTYGFCWLKNIRTLKIYFFTAVAVQSDHGQKCLICIYKKSKNPDITFYHLEIKIEQKNHIIAYNYV